ncbi:unnamed protein product, partial [Mucor fragilis]
LLIMQLRARKSRVLGNSKQKNYLAELTLDEASSSIINEGITASFTIKQEDAKNYSSLLEQEDPDYYYSCDICNERIPNYMSVLQHRNSIHNIGNKHIKTIQQVDEVSDIRNLNVFCKPCQVAYDNELSHTQHMKYAHYMVLKSPSRGTETTTDIVSDADNADLLHCKSCNQTFEKNSAYKRHCRYIHNIKTFRNATQEDIVDTFAYCKPCNRNFVNKYSYRSHVLGIHGISWKLLLQQKQKDVMPDANDPNFYCRSCEKKLSSKYSFDIHLNVVHSIFPSSRSKSSLKSDTDNLNNRCQACQNAYSSKSKYCTHICLVNQTALSTLENQDMPDPDDSHHYCRVCKVFYSTRGTYRFHCKISHCMVLKHASIVNSTAKINTNDPNFYCAQCEHSYSSKSSFKNHLMRVHSQ